VTGTAHDTATRWPEVEQHRRLVTEVLLALGATATTAGAQADVLVEGDLRGHPSHGLQRLPMLVDRIRGGLADPATSGEHAWRSRSVLAVDGGRGLGPPVAFAALDAIVERAGQEGVAIAAISNANHLGMLAPYVERAAIAGVAAMATTTSEPLVHPWGGRDAGVGTNPLALAVPTPEDPVVLDMATGAVSRGKVIDHANRDDPLPAGVAVDAAGDPTTDPHAALEGAITPFGGPKGYALAAGLEFLVGALTTSALGRDVVGTLDASEVCNKGDLLLCFAPEVVAGTDRRDVLAAFVRELRATRPADPEQPVSVPGDRSRELRARRAAEGRVPVSGRVWAQVAAIAEELDVARPGSVPTSEEDTAP
jgi:L-2-hydroxycarboxylate dehydrogenase (NAD+)